MAEHNTHQPVNISDDAIERAENTWKSFMEISKVSTYATVVILALLWFFFIAL